MVRRPRLHLIRFHGVLAPNAKLRAAIVASPAHHATEHSADHAHAHSSPARMSWARACSNAYSMIDIEYCPQGDGTMRIIAFITEPHAIKAILAHLGEPIACAHRGPPLAARRCGTWRSRRCPTGLTPPTRAGLRLRPAPIRVTVRASSRTWPSLLP